MDIDVIMLTNSKDIESTMMTQRTIMSLHDSEANHKFNIHLVESGEDKKSEYESITKNYIFPSQTFNYNKFLNIALEYVTSDWVVITNNDVIYERNWFTEMMKVNEIRPDILSFSPRDPIIYMKYFPYHFIGGQDTYYESYKVTEAFMGWCVVMRNDALKSVCPFDELFDMYYQDNDLAERLKEKNIKHALVRYSLAYHKGTIDITELTEAKIRKMTVDEIKFRKKWNQ
jgi:GT2 family glycosyltransferase